jgi:excisionase family DNA binding protein
MNNDEVILKFPSEMILTERTILKEIIRDIVNEISIEKNEIMTIKETAEFLKVSVPTVRAWIAANDIPHIQKGQVIRLNRIDVSAWSRGRIH